MCIQRAEFAVYNARAVDLLKRWQEHRVPSSDVDTIAGPQPDSIAALLGYEPEAIPLGLEDPPFIVEGSVDECREHRSISGVHAHSTVPGPGLGQRRSSLRPPQPTPRVGAKICVKTIKSNCRFRKLSH